MWWRPLLVFFLMAGTDTFDALKTLLTVKERRFWAANADFAVEVGDFGWLALGIDSFVKKGLTVELLWIVLAMYAGSIAGLYLGVAAEHWFLRHFPPDIPETSPANP
jgi:hypothetical protein